MSFKVDLIQITDFVPLDINRIKLKAIRQAQLLNQRIGSTSFNYNGKVKGNKLSDKMQQRSRTKGILTTEKSITLLLTTTECFTDLGKLNVLMVGRF